MELIKISDTKARLYLDAEEREDYGLCREKKENIKAIAKIFSRLKEVSGIDLADSSFRVRIIFLASGNCEITLEAIEDTLKIHTFLFNRASLERAFHALEKSEAMKSSALYEYKNGIYIWEYLGKDSSPFPQRLSDFGQKIFLRDRRDFLTVLCRRLPFFEKNVRS